MTDDKSNNEIGDSPEQHSARPSSTSGDVGNKPDHNTVHGDDQPNNADRQPRPMEFISRLWGFIREPRHSNAIMAIFTAMIFVSGLAYTIFSALQWRETKKAAEAAQGANNAARDALVRSLRPWLGISATPKITQIPKLDKNGYATLPMSFNIQNFGTSPALHVGLGLNVVTWLPLDKPSSPKDFSRFKAATDFACGAADMDWVREVLSKGRRGEYGEYIFPTQSSEFSRDALQEHFYVEPKSPIRILGCIAYTDQFNIIHHTRFCYKADATIDQISVNQSLATCSINENAD